ncbi:5-formyltetrahydrofolate cyclo-ligase [Novosphingobium mangrovi (ex Huang et al. 2023)]|uniref:5-formyltetrahydrofolate cyclo-ligase n=1 Tax=Novosphingobium mangrovi (ex Huang et al. 2023) TaxID=2976432 RepID=A0ABT2I893_9SPHN|nr:5-formyltetrahydrofolate cyclo-ligase [Novosphingobium mangrovi (ex Huang et al. 2023)]MCT2401032.1 5-formyltetrahydrofolate cyclo-ligase [Novosphingobium mangrovi (ex Huang et al. 2023)]
MSPAEEKTALRKAYRKARADHVSGLPEGLRALVLNRPPAPVVAKIPEGATVGLYHPAGTEAPATGWARWFSENGRRIALPWFSARDAAMEFRAWANPWDETGLEPGPWRALQPLGDDGPVIPDVVVVPLLAFTAAGHRLGQGGGHYDRWLDAHPQVPAIGLAWDCQIAEELPHEAHDRPLAAVVTPTRIYEGHD